MWPTSMSAAVLRRNKDEGDKQRAAQSAIIQRRSPSVYGGNHLQVWSVLGRTSALHNTVRDALSHLVVQNGVTDAAVEVTLLTAAHGSTFDADVIFIYPSSRSKGSS